MDKQSEFELQKIDCNCNNCAFMVRDFEKYKFWTEKYKENRWLDKPKIQYGTCQKLNKPVSFIPNWCQIETQHCFVHRKDLPNE